ncbi:phage filamentation protein Fil family protein [Erwinia sp. Leaf53]|uniref:phage filamentation protein Fil family protein n=1 Tax=Erwinia sp. Leaf53 TaxID=1736225 RepID=UPI00092FA210|nr:phage filamentation protein Fil family protein [Erwinia sp. Leaf53]
MAISVAPMLKRQSPSMAYGHGWISGDKGKKWHPCNEQSELLRGMANVRRKNILARIVGIFGG